ncbi:peptidase m50 [Nannochloropsis oceanica]
MNRTGTGNNPAGVADNPFPKQWAWQMGTIHLKGQVVPVKLHFLLPIFWVLSLLSGLAYGGTYIGFRFIIDVLILFVTVFAHELGHSYAAIQYSGKCHCITLWPLGGFAEVTHEQGPKEDLWVSFAGPLTHVPMCAIWYGIVAAVVRGPFNIMTIPCDLFNSQPCFWTNVCVSAGFLNICLFLFNLLIPAYPLDASRILVDFFALCKVEVNKAALITAGISMPIGLGLLCYGFWGFSRGAANYTMTLFLAIFILYSTWGVFKAARSGNAARHPMFVHYYRTSVPVDASSSSSSSSSTTGFGAANATAGGRIMSLWGGGSATAGADGDPAGTGGPVATSGGVTAFSKMEAGKGHRLGGKAAPTGVPAAAPVGGGRSTSQSALLSSQGSSSSSNILGGPPGGKGGHRLGSK